MKKQLIEQQNITITSISCLSEFDPALYTTFLNIGNRCEEKKDIFKCYDKKLIRGLGSIRTYYLASPCSLNNVLIEGGYCAENSWN